MYGVRGMEYLRGGDRHTTQGHAPDQHRSRTRGADAHHEGTCARGRASIHRHRRIGSSARRRDRARLHRVGRGRSDGACGDELRGHRSAHRPDPTGARGGGLHSDHLPPGAGKRSRQRKPGPGMCGSVDVHRQTHGHRGLSGRARDQRRHHRRPQTVGTHGRYRALFGDAGKWDGGDYESLGDLPAGAGRRRPGFCGRMQHGGYPSPARGSTGAGQSLQLRLSPTGGYRH